MKNCKIIFTDLDGTLLRHDRTISKEDLAVLEELGKRDIVRVLATGRSLYSLGKIFDDDFPHFDYIIFSCGVGILNWNTREILYSHFLSRDEIARVRQILNFHNIDHMIHKPVPENHKFHYQKFSTEINDFDRRFSYYKNCGSPLTSDENHIEKASQVLAVIPKDTRKFEMIKNLLPDLRVIRTTSPIDHTSLWIEIFPKNVSKGHAAEWLCSHLDISQQDTFSIGNDYNDIELLDWTAYSYVVENAPDEMKKKYKNTSSNQSSGFSKVIRENIL